MKAQIDNSTLSQYEKDLQELERLRTLKEQRYLERLAKARRDYVTFAETVLKDESTGGKIKMAPIHLKWIEHIQFAWSHGLHAVILAPYGSGKTFQCGVGIPLYLFGHDTSLRMMLVSANDKIARDRLGLIRQYIEYSDEYHEVFPNVRADESASWTKSELFLKRTTMAKDPSLCACGVTSSGIGKRTDIIVFDDVNDAKNTIHQPKMRDVIWQNFTGPFISRLEPGGKVLIIATRWHEQDLIGMLMEDTDMRRKYAFLIQRVTEDFEGIECETIIPADLTEQAVKHRSEESHLFSLYNNGVI